MAAGTARRVCAGLLVALLGGGALPATAATPTAADCQLLDPQEGWQPLPACGIDVAGGPVIDPEALRDLPYDDQGNVAIVVGQGFHYVKADGRRLQVIPWDNGPDPFEEGLVRGPIEGDRMAYFNNDFVQAVPGTFTFAWPFREGRAEVCNGCRPGPPQGEHTPMVGGGWFHIDRQGRRMGDVREGPRQHATPARP